MKSEVIAMFPISNAHVDRIFKLKRNVFVKYTHFSRLNTGSKIVFYVSGKKKLVGEGIIERIEKIDPEIAWARHKQQIFLNEDEYYRYALESPIGGKNRKESKITVFILKKVKKYKTAVEWKCGFTLAGRYLTPEDYAKTVNQ